MQKAINFWNALEHREVSNPFALQPTVRPPGTVLMSYPFGYTLDFSGFHFRSVFLPILCIVVAVYVVAGARAYRDKINDWWAAAVAFLFSSLPMFYHFDGRVVRDYLYIDDLAEAFARAVYYDGAHSILNIGSGVGTDINSLLDAIESVLERPVTRHYKPGQAFDVPANVLDITRAGKELDWQPGVPLSQGMEIMLKRRTA